LLFLSKRSEKRASHMSGTETSRISDVQGLVTEVAADLPGKGATGFSQYSQLKGTLRCDNPVEAELSESRVAMYETLIEREIETRYEERDADGNRQVRWRRSTEVMSRNHRAAPFYLDDGSGRVRVVPDGANIDLETSVNRFEPPEQVERGGSIAWGPLSVRLGAIGSDRRTVGYRFIERVLPLDRPLYALGDLVDTDEGLVMRRPEDKERPFIVSLKSEDQLVASAESSSKYQRIGAMVLAVMSVILVVAHFVQ